MGGTEGDDHIKAVMRRRKEAKEQVRFFAKALAPAGLSVRVREEIDLTTAYVRLPSRDAMTLVADAEKAVVQQYSDLSFEIIVYYSEDLKRGSIRALIDRAVAV
jgi:hypothetical protein